MEIVNVESGTLTTIGAYVTDTNGDGVGALSPTFVLKCLGPNGSANLNMFYDFSNALWSSTPVENVIPAVTGVTGAYVFRFDKASLGAIDTDYLVRIETAVGFVENPLRLFKYLGTLEKKLAALLSVMSPAREEIHRISNETLELRYFDESDVETARFLVTHDSSGNQPEQTKEKVL